MSEISNMIRTAFAEGDERRDKGLSMPDNILRFDDIAYGDHMTWQLLDVYRPRERKEEILPVIVSVHGGGWVYGDKDKYQYYCMAMAQRGFAVVNFSYRLAPEYKFPAPIEDTNSVFSWVIHNADRFGFDPEHIFAVGDSAGAHTLARYTAICTNKSYAKQYGFQVPDRFFPKAISLNCGVYAPKPAAGEKDITQKLLEDYLPDKGNKENWQRIKVVDFITEKFPTVFISTAVGDFLADQAVVLADKLTKANVPFQYRYYGNSDNPPGHVFHLDIRNRLGQQCIDEECMFFLNHIGTDC